MTPATQFLSLAPDDAVNASPLDAVFGVFCAAFGWSFVASIALATAAHGGGLTGNQFTAMGFGALASLNFLTAAWRAKGRIQWPSAPRVACSCAVAAVLACGLMWLAFANPQLAKDVAVVSMLVGALLNWRFSKLKVRADG